MARHYEPTETRRQQIAEAALQVLAEDGVARFTTRAIARRVGVTDGTLFRHFADKQEIVLAAMDLLEEQLLIDLEDDGDPVARLEAMFRHRAAFVGSNSSVGRLLFSDQLVHLAGDAGRSKVLGWRMLSMAFMHRALAESRGAGQLSTTADVLSLAMVIQGSLLTFALQASLGAPQADAALQGRIDVAWETLHTLLFR